ncbi:MAG: TetR/AcrR family transcriptional regulator [Bacteroidota bacterium]
MNTIQKDNTENKILDAAQTVFIQKGMDGARMQEIANEAGINKALLHYYFRTKQKLFEAIFQMLFSQVFPNIETLVLSDLPIKEKLGTFIEKYIDLLLKNPFLPTFILKEINRDPEFLASVIKSQGIKPEQIFEMLEKEMDAGKIRRMDPREIMVNMLGLSVFPFAAKPLMKLMFFENDKKAYNQFLKERKNTVKEFVLNSILMP